jgi:hypothetical protein
MKLALEKRAATHDSHDADILLAFVLSAQAEERLQ